MDPFCFKLIQIIFLMCLVFQAYQLVCSKEVVRCIQSERQALLQFKAALIDEYDNMLSSWRTEDCCQWKGVGCNNVTSHVLKLNLHGDYNSYYIRGDIHKSLMELQQLQYLNLSGNNFIESILPDFFGSLRNLRYLDLSYCNFGGQIPIQFESLSHLKYLNLSFNHLYGLIPHQIGDLSNLQFLDLSYNDLEGSVPSQLGNLSNLQYLDLLGNSLKGKIPSQLGKLTNLQELYLGRYFDSALTIDNGDHNGGQWLSNLTSLTHLIMWSITNLDNFNRWFQMVGKLPKLRELGLISCGLSDHFIHSLSQSKFNFTTSLSILDLSWNNFKSSVVFQWVSNISSNLVELDLYGNLLEAPPSSDYGIVMKSLDRLDLSHNRLKGGAFKSFMTLCALRSLDMKEINFTEDLQLILQNMSSCCVRNSLQVLDLSSNGITGTLPDLSIFTSLKTLDLSDNKLRGKIAEGSTLPFQLEQFHIRSNSLEGGIPKAFWMNACKLKSLDLSNNSFSGELQVLIHHLSRCARYSLQEINLSNNQINGTLSNLSIFSSLEIFDISENKVNGVISDFHFSGMSMLKKLSLSDNSLALRFTQSWMPPFQLHTIGLGSCKLGLTFPKWIQTQKHLYHLDISNAGISGNVPEWFWSKLSSQKCWRIDISNNNLKGTIPNLQVKNYCSVVSLSSNEFEGPIPPFLRGSGFIDLSKNKFTDSRQFLCENGTDMMLGQFDVSNNQLSGQVPNCWSNFKALVYLDLSHNNLTEEIPFSLMNCKNLVMLDLRENKLKGPIPHWIGNELKELEVLSLKKNHFFGSLLFELCFPQNIQFLDLSLNNLSGRIPKCLKNLTSMTQKGSSRDFNNHYYGFRQRSVDYLVPYELNAFLTWKGGEHVFNNNGLVLLKVIDLSSNHFSEEIPPEIEDLIQLVSLNYQETTSQEKFLQILES